MKPQTCTRCGGIVENEGIRHRRWFFCSDECCETFEEGFLNRGGPDAVDLEEGDTDDEFDEEFFDSDADDDADVLVYDDLDADDF